MSSLQQRARDSLVYAGVCVLLAIFSHRISTASLIECIESEELALMCDTGKEIDLISNDPVTVAAGVAAAVVTPSNHNHNHYPLVLVRGKVVLVNNNPLLYSYNDVGAVILETVQAEELIPSHELVLKPKDDFTMSAWGISSSLSVAASASSAATSGKKNATPMVIHVDLIETKKCLVAQNQIDFPNRKPLSKTIPRGDQKVAPIDVKSNLLRRFGVKHGGLVHGGSFKVERTWDEYFNGKTSISFLLHRILPIFSSVSIIGRLTVDQSGTFHITLHPSVGMIMFKDVSFVSVAATCRSMSNMLRSRSSFCANITNVLLGFSFAFAVGGLYFNFVAAGSGFGGGGGAKTSKAGEVGVGDIKEVKDGDNNNNNNSNDECVICLTERKCVMLKPCNHICLCDNCSALSEKAVSLCPICRKKWTSRERVFF